MQQIKKRAHHLTIKLLGFKALIWIMACVFLWFDKLTGTDWVLLSGAIGGLNVWQKAATPGGGYVPPSP